MIHPKVEAAFQEIDAAFFSGDTFEDEDARERVKFFLARWNKEVAKAPTGQSCRVGGLMNPDIVIDKDEDCEGHGEGG